MYLAACNIFLLAYSCFPIIVAKNIVSRNGWKYLSVQGVVQENNLDLGRGDCSKLGMAGGSGGML